MFVRDEECCLRCNDTTFSANILYSSTNGVFLQSLNDKKLCFWENVIKLSLSLSSGATTKASNEWTSVCRQISNFSVEPTHSPRFGWSCYPRQQSDVFSKPFGIILHSQPRLTLCLGYPLPIAALSGLPERNKVPHRGSGDESRSRTVYAKLESNSEPKRARVCQKVAVRASESQSGSHREP